MYSLPPARQAIRTRYIGPTNTKPARIQSKCEAGTIYVSYGDALNQDQNHRHAALQLMMRLGLQWTLSPNVGVFDGDYYHVSI